MTIDENWTVDPRRVCDFFAGLPGAVKTGDGFILDGCQVTLTPVEGMVMGKWPLRRTRIRIHGEDSAVDALYQKFFLRFLSAGG